MSWPGQMRTVFGDHQRFIDTYFSTFPGRYFSGDGCRRDEDGYYWITGRVDDVINVSGHRMGTAEVESALVAHTDVAEAAVVGYWFTAFSHQCSYCCRSSVEYINFMFIHYFPESTYSRVVWYTLKH